MVIQERQLLRSTLLFTALTVLMIPAAFAQTKVAFDASRETTLTVKAFTDRQIGDSLASLDALLASEKDTTKWPAHAETVLWKFARYLQGGRLSAAQEQLVLKHLDRIADSRGDQGTVVAGPRFMVSALTVGKTAPDILGKDLDGADLRLSDFRGRVVVLVFSAEWCGICRSLFPYERLMLELYKNWPFTILGIETGSSAAILKQAKASESLAYRSWWDSPGADGRGPIASAWNVGGYPAVYVLDDRGVIRFVDVRYEDLLKGVRQLLSEPTVVAKK